MNIILRPPDSSNPSVLLKQVQESFRQLELSLARATGVVINDKNAKNSFVVDYTDQGIQVGVADSKGKRDLVNTKTLGAVADSDLRYCGSQKGVGSTPNFDAFKKGVGSWMFWENTATSKHYLCFYVGGLTVKKIELI